MILAYAIFDKEMMMDMKKKLALSCTLLLSSFIISISNTVIADEMFSMDDISRSLQTEYQSQLVLQPRTTYKKTPRKQIAKKQPVQKQTANRKVVRHIQPANQAVARTPIPQADDLFNAASQGNINLIGRLIREGLNINVANRERETALHIAAARGRYSAVIYLINHGANIHARTIKNWLPLHHATRFRHANIANYLLKKGVSPHARTSDGLSAIDMARSVGNHQLLGLFGAN